MSLDWEEAVRPMSELSGTRVDFHTHTNASDGVLTPTELVKRAVEKNLTAVAVTDHDSVSGIKEARQAALMTPGFFVIPGVELSAEWKGIEVHVLGYGIRWEDKRLAETLKTIRDQRFVRAEAIIKRLEAQSIAFGKDEVEELLSLKNPGRLHIARQLVQKGVVRTTDEAFFKYLKKGGKAYAPRYKITPREAVRIISQAGGIPVLAHPGLMERDELIPDFVRDGIQGLEAYYPTHDPASTYRYLQMAHQYDLLVTGGSDFHAPPAAKIRSSDLGTCSLSLKEAQGLLNRIEERAVRRES